MVPGHIPSAKNIPWSKTVREDDGTTTTYTWELTRN